MNNHPKQENTTMKNDVVKQQNTSTKRVIGRPFQKGQSGNPAGRPRKGETVTEVLRSMALELHAGNITRAEALARILWDSALGGDSKAIDVILDRLEGKPRQSLELAPPPPPPIRIEIVDPMDPDSQLAQGH